jgi:hypothetical protein
MTLIPIKSKVFNKDSFSKIIDNQFKQLINNNSENDNLEFSLEDFFIIYEQLFYQIPKEGESNSHQYIINKEADYLGITLNNEDVQALLNEITVLRQEITSAQQTIQSLNEKING